MSAIRTLGFVVCAAVVCAGVVASAANSDVSRVTHPAVAPVACMGTPVKGSGTIHVGPFTGHATLYEVVRHRFALRVGTLRAPGLSQKIPWFVRSDESLGETLRVEGVRLRPGPPLTFAQEFPTGGEFTGGRMYPSVFAPNGVGCWRITLTAGTVSVRLFALVRPPAR